MPLYATPQMTSFRSAAALEVPPGAIVAFRGSAAVAGTAEQRQQAAQPSAEQRQQMAEIPEGWQLCNGENGTPDLRDKFIRATGAGFALHQRGGGTVTGSTSTEGLHTGPRNAAGNATTSHANAYGRLADGAHSHSLIGVLEPPPYHSLLLIRASRALELPAGAIVHSLQAGALRGTQTLAELRGRFLRGSDQDRRTNGGSTRRDYTIQTATAGAHNHGDGGYSAGVGNRSYSSREAGAHTHGTVETGTTEELPPYLVLQPLVLLEENGAVRGMILHYDGNPDDLPAGWRIHTPAAGRFLLGADDSRAIGESGGQETLELNGTTPNKTIRHDHDQCCSGYNRAFRAPHRAYNWTHRHSWSARLDLAPPFHCLHTIERI